jgi:hypothetical protein
MERSRALALLSECHGDDIWSIDYCRKARIPEDWILQLRDAYESGFDSQGSKIFYRESIVNQFEGVRDVDLACKIGDLLGVRVSSIVQSQPTRMAVVQAIKEAIEEGE